MAVAPLLREAGEPDEAEALSLITLVNEQREAGVEDNTEIASNILRANGIDESHTLFPILTAALREAVRTAIGSAKRHAIGVRNYAERGEDGGIQQYMRMALAPHAAWSAEYIVLGNRKQLRDFTLPELDALIRDYRKRARVLLFHVKWLEQVRELTRVHHVVETVGELERKGISLPELEEAVTE